MKKLVCLGLVAAMVVSLAACGSSNTKSTESKATESAAASESSADQAEAASGLKDCIGYVRCSERSGLESDSLRRHSESLREIWM